MNSAELVAQKTFVCRKQLEIPPSSVLAPKAHSETIKQKNLAVVEKRIR
jgi:hypothetical protein